MRFVAWLFAPLILAIGALGLWLAIEHDRERVFALGPAAEAPETPGALTPGAGPSPSAPSPGKAEAERPALERFARPFDRSDRRPRIAVVVTGLGLAQAQTLRAIEETPPEVTLAFSAYADDVASLAARARARGHEILVAVPMEPADPKRRDAGPAALAISMSDAAARDRLVEMLARVQGSIGIIGDLGDRFSRDPLAMRPVLEELAARGMAYVDNRLESGERAAADGPIEVATGSVPVAAVNAWLDRAAAGEDALAAVEAAARRGGGAVIVAGPADVGHLAAWMQNFERKGLVAAPVSAVVRGGM